MSRDIEYIQNVIAYATIDDTGKFSIQGGFPTNPDEVVIRQITYDSDDAQKVLYLIHSNLSNGIIACVGNINGFVSNPGTRIQTRNPVSNVLTFELFLANKPLIPIADGAELDQICISMDFIKWKK